MLQSETLTAQQGDFIQSGTVLIGKGVTVTGREMGLISIQHTQVRIVAKEGVGSVGGKLLRGSMGWQILAKLTS